VELEEVQPAGLDGGENEGFVGIDEQADAQNVGRQVASDLGGVGQGEVPGALVVEDEAEHVRAGGDGGLGVGEVGDSANFDFGAHVEILCTGGIIYGHDKVNRHRAVFGQNEVIQPCVEHTHAIGCAFPTVI